MFLISYGFFCYLSYNERNEFDEGKKRILQFLKEAGVPFKSKKDNLARAANHCSRICSKMQITFAAEKASTAYRGRFFVLDNNADEKNGVVASEYAIKPL